MKRIFFTVTNELVYDQRMERICGSLARNGYEVTLVGRRGKHSPALREKKYNQYRLKCWFSKGKEFYIEFNIRLFFYLLFQKMDCVCAIDLDTILPVLMLTRLKKIPRVYDAHELFCEMKEVVTRPFIYKIWKSIERVSLPRFTHGYTVCQPIAGEFEKLYGCHYEVIRNMPLLQENIPLPNPQKYILYQGAVNEGRSFETLIPAMKNVEAPLIVCGDGNFMQQAKELVERYGLSDKIFFKGMLPPSELKYFTCGATIGITLFENTGKSNYFSLANRFFDYMHACVPQLCVDYPCYAAINDQFKVAVLIGDLDPATISNALNNLLTNDVVYQTIRANCLRAREIYNWQAEEKKLVGFYGKIFT